MTEVQLSDNRLVLVLVFSWGFSAFFPIGVAYAHFLLLLLVLAVRGGLPARVAALQQGGLLLPMALFGLWTLLVLALGERFPDSATRLFHVVRVLLVLLLGMLLTAHEARAALAGFLCGGVVAALIVALHHVVGLPPWDIWSSLLASRNNKSSANMIMMAIGAGLFFYAGLRNDPHGLGRWIAWAAALALGVTVALHSVSRNAQLLVPLLAAVAFVCYGRRWQAVLAATVAVVVVAASAMVWSPATQSRFLTAVAQARAVVTQSDYTTGVGERWRMASEALRGMLERPVLGTGLGSWAPRWREVAIDTAGDLGPQDLQRHIEINNPHNDFLLTGMETGLPGLLIMVWLIGAFALRGWRNRSAMGDTTVMLATSLCAVALINAPLRDAAMGMTMLWLLGASVAGHEPRGRSPAQSRRARHGDSHGGPQTSDA